MHADSEDMQIIDIHLAEMAGWRALLSKAQFVAKLELHTMLEEYLVRMLYRTTRELLNKSSIWSVGKRIQNELNDEQAIDPG